MTPRTSNGPPPGGASAGLCCVTHQGDGGSVRVAPVGELDIATAPQLSDVLTGAGESARLVTVDLSGVTFIDSAGLHVLLELDGRLRSRGGHLRVLPGSRAVKRVLRISGADQQLDVLPRAVDTDADGS